MGVTGSAKAMPADAECGGGRSKPETMVPEVGIRDKEKPQWGDESPGETPGGQGKAWGWHVRGRIQG